MFFPGTKNSAAKSIRREFIFEFGKLAENLLSKVDHLQDFISCQPFFFSNHSLIIGIDAG
jgi:hypothetical protein